MVVGVSPMPANKDKKIQKEKIEFTGIKNKEGKKEKRKKTQKKRDYNVFKHAMSINYKKSNTNKKIKRTSRGVIRAKIKILDKYFVLMKSYDVNAIKTHDELAHVHQHYISYKTQDLQKAENAKIEEFIHEIENYFQALLPRFPNTCEVCWEELNEISLYTREHCDHGYRVCIPCGQQLSRCNYFCKSRKIEEERRMGRRREEVWEEIPQEWLLSAINTVQPPIFTRETI